ncbi:putative NAD(P)H dehydrogenase (quinone) [Helianthus annuus]|nr:putative NAD(P)H dehydrogenase (quinone) [Helianthus annuus]
MQVPEALNEEVLEKMTVPPKSDVPIITRNELFEGNVFGFPTRFGHASSAWETLHQSLRCNGAHKWKKNRINFL